jgi:hypothetical protein
VELHQDLGLVHPRPFMDSVCPTIASTPFFPTAGTRRPEYKTDRSILLEKIATQAIPESSCLQREILSRPPVAAHIVPSAVSAGQRNREGEPRKPRRSGDFGRRPLQRDGNSGELRLKLLYSVLSCVCASAASYCVSNLDLQPDVQQNPTSYWDSISEGSC